MVKKNPIFKWYEKIGMYFIAFIVIAFIIIMGDIKKQKEIDEKIQECYQFLEKHEKPTN